VGGWEIEYIIVDFLRLNRTQKSTCEETAGKHASGQHPFPSQYGNWWQKAFFAHGHFIYGMLNYPFSGERRMYIAIEGVIGVGKTTLARLLQPRFENSELLLEVFEENPFLSDFYGDRARYAFQTQIFFLLSRYRQQNSTVPAILERGATLLADYTFAKDALFARINLHGDELTMYHRVHEALAEKIPLPNLTVYLSASVDTLMARIALRDRSYERTMERAYIAELVDAYDDFFASSSSPNLTIDSNALDFVRYPEHLALIANRIREALGITPYQPALLDGD